MVSDQFMSELDQPPVKKNIVTKCRIRCWLCLSYICVFSKDRPAKSMKAAIQHFEKKTQRHMVVCRPLTALKRAPVWKYRQIWLFKFLLAFIKASDASWNTGASPRSVSFSSWCPLDAHPPDPALAAEFGRFNRVLGSTSMTELAFHSTVANFVNAINIIPKIFTKVDKEAGLELHTSSGS